jgi:6-phosphogluconolactonase (cycloisomerase 2 family)
MKPSLVTWTLALSLAATSFGQEDWHRAKHAVFVMTNNAKKNEIVAYQRADSGALQETGRFETGGRGSGGGIDPLVSQGSLVLSDDHRLLFAVNAASGTLSVFRVWGSELRLVDVKPTLGAEPTQVTQHGDLVYVANAAAASSVVGFHVDGDGRLERIGGSLRFLSGTNVIPAGIGIRPDGEVLVVTERGDGKIDVFQIQADGTLGPLVSNSDATAGVFAPSFAPDGALVVAQTGPPSSMSSFWIESTGALAPISVAVPTLGAATCWQAITPDGKFVYTANAGTSNISGFALNAGALTALPGTIAATNAAGATNLDVAISSDGAYLYTLNSGNGSVGIFSIHASGALTSAGVVTGLPQAAGLNGIAAY